MLLNTRSNITSIKLFLPFFYSGRILFVDNGNQVTTWIDPRTGKSADGKTEEELGLLMESPPSPLSLMDVITVGSPVNIDSVISESSSSSIGKRNMPEISRISTYLLK